MPEEEPRTFAAFWPFYLRQHARSATRKLHFAGTSAVVLMAMAAAARRQPSLLVLLPLLGYGPAWIAHFCVEKNRPATFRYPRWSLCADFKMWAMMLRGRLWDDTSEDRPR